MSRRLCVVVKPIAGLAVGTDILGPLAQVGAAQRHSLCIPKGMQADWAQCDEGYGIQLARVATAHRCPPFLCIVDIRKARQFGKLFPAGGPKSCLGFLPPFVLDAPGRIGNLLAADLHRSIGISAAPPSLWPGRELRKYHCLEVPEGCLFIFQGPLASGLSSVWGGPCCDSMIP